MIFVTRWRDLILFILIIYTTFSQISQAGIFKDEESLVASQKKAETLKEQVLPGKIVVSNSDNTTWSDFTSATPIGMPEATQTKTILSCAHNFPLWGKNNEWKKPNKNYNFYFCDSLGKEHRIVDAIPLSTNNMDAINDIAVYYLEDYIPCHPSNTIDRELSQNLNLSSLSYGWGLVSSNVPLACNFLGENPYYLQNSLYLNQNNLYAHVYTVDRLLHLSNIYNEHRYSYFACNTQDPPFHQIYMHDSGSSWIKDNSVGGFSLTALASEEQAVTDNIVKTMDRQDNILGEIHLLDDFFTLKVHELNTRKFAVNLFTPLAPHRDWIYRQVR